MAYHQFCFFCKLTTFSLIAIMPCGGIGSNLSNRDLVSKSLLSNQTVRRQVRLDLEIPLLSEIENADIEKSPNSTFAKYTITNSSEDILAFNVSYSPHTFAKLKLSSSGISVQHKQSLARMASVGKIVYLEPFQQYSAIARLDHLFNLPQSGIFSLQASMVVDILGGEEFFKREEVTVSSNPVSFKIDKKAKQEVDKK